MTGLEWHFPSMGMYVEECQDGYGVCPAEEGSSFKPDWLDKEVRAGDTWGVGGTAGAGGAVWPAPSARLPK